MQIHDTLAQARQRQPCCSQSDAKPLHQNHNAVFSFFIFSGTLCSIDTPLQIDDLNSIPRAYIVTILNYVPVRSPVISTVGGGQTRLIRCLLDFSEIKQGKSIA
jgi:hypothetical protein